MAADSAHTEAVRKSIEAGFSKVHKYVDYEMHAALKHILETLRKGPNARHFLEPVDKTKLPHYYVEIKQPMDLGTIKTKLASDLSLPWSEKNYLTAEEFAHDVRLVFKNCFLFNPVNHYIFNDGKNKLERFEKDLATLYRAIDVESKNSAPLPLDVRCQLLLTDLRRNPLTEWFRREADWAQFGETYLQAISSGKPMDLDRIQANLDNGAYADQQRQFDISAFASDVHLVWQNAIDFNGENLFGVIANVMQQMVDRRLRDVRESPRPRSSRALTVASRKRRSELYEACMRLSRDLAVASEVVNVIERACPSAVTRQKSSEAEVGTDAEVDLDQVDDDMCEELLQQLKSIHRRGGAGRRNAS